MNWEKRLNNAWKSYFSKQKATGKSSSPTIQTFANSYKKRLKTIEHFLQHQNYIFGEWQVIWKAKSDGGERPLMIPININDRIVLKVLSDYLSELLAPKFRSVQNISFAYQKGKSTRDALLQLKKIHSPNNILLKLDIKHFFDEIDKDILMQEVGKLTIDNYTKQLIRQGITPTIDNSRLTPDQRAKIPTTGIPQGNPMSAVLSNLYLLELDQLAISHNWRMVRYADDMVFSVSNLKEAHLILSQVKQYLFNNRKLSIHPLSNTPDAKTAIFQNNKKLKMKYLGVIFNGEKLFPTDECCAKLIMQIKNILQISSTSSTVKETRITQVITQWCGYYAFTDITNHKIKELDRAIKYQINKYGLNIHAGNMADSIAKARKRQHHKFFKLFSSIHHKEIPQWLTMYS